MADEWEEEETAKPVGGQSKYGRTNSSNNKKTSDDGWSGSNANNGGGSKTDDWASGGGGSKKDDWASGGGGAKKDDWASGGNNNDTWTSNNDSWGGGQSTQSSGGQRNGFGGGGGGRARTNWICTQSSCAGLNFGNRQDCFKCHEPKGDAVDIPEDPNSRGGGGNRPSDWICTDSSCAGRNFGNRTECFKCKLPKGDAADAPADSSGGGFRNNRGSDWICTDSSCAGKNFASRTECFKCKLPKGDAADAPADSSGGGFRNNRGSDWICTDSSCAGKNFASRTECFKCKLPKGDAKDAPADASGGGFRSNRGGEWICTDSSCAAKNFASRTECYKCQLPKGDAKDAPSESNGHSGENGGSDFQTEKPREFYIPADIDETELFTKGISSGINFNKFKDIPVKVDGKDKPESITSFANSGLDPFLLNNIKRCEYSEPTPIQKTSIPIVMKGRDLMACAQTGSGKTAAFLLPIINTLLTDNRPTEPGSPQVLILSPTRELAKQIHFEAIKFSKDSILKSVVIYGGTATRHDAAHIGTGFHILVATPGRLLDFAEKGMIQFNCLRFLVLDEADRMLDMGFKESIEKVLRNPTMTPGDKRQTLMFSATFPSDIQRMAGKYLNNYIFVSIGIVGGACNDVEQIIYESGRYKKRDQLMEILKAEDPKGTMVFVETKRNADFLASFLSESKQKSTSIHGDRLQRQREEALNDFSRGTMKVLIATSVAARGLDIPDVRHVINYDLPKSIEDYVHRIGRTGRVGNQGKATSFYDSEQDSALANDLVKILKQANQNVPDFLAVGGTGGGGDGYQQNQFGGRDIRKYSPEAHGGGADDEQW